MNVCRNLSIVVLATLFQPSLVAFACGYEDPKSASFHRGILNWGYPNALYVQGALTQAHLAGIIEPAPPAAKDLLGRHFRKAADMLRQFGAELRPDEADEFAFTVVLIEPMLWARYTVSGGSVRTSVHVKGPENGDLVVVTAEAALKEIEVGRLTFQRAEELGLVRCYGDSAKSERLRALAAGRQEVLDQANTMPRTVAQ